MGGTRGHRRRLFDLAEATGRHVDADGDGRDDDAPVYITTNDALNAQIATALEHVAAASRVTFELLEIVVEDDPYGVVDSITPSWFPDVGAGDPLPFEVQLYGVSTDEAIQSTVVLSVLGDGVVIDTIELDVEIAPD